MTLLSNLPYLQCIQYEMCKIEFIHKYNNLFNNLFYDMPHKEPPKYVELINNDFIPDNSYITYIVRQPYISNINYLPTGIQFIYVYGKNLNMLPHTIRYIDIDCCVNQYDKLPINIQMINMPGEYECEYRLRVNGKEKVVWTRGVVTFEDGKPMVMKGAA